MANLTLIQAVNAALRQEMERDAAVVCLGEDIGRNGGVFRATEGLQQQFGAERVIDTPLSESGIIGTSIGMAINGLRPVAEIQFEGFLSSGFDQIVSHVARYRTRTRGCYPMPLVIRAPWGGGIRAPEHHSDSPEAWFVHTPGLKVVIPATPYDAKGLLVAAIRDNDPVIFFEPKKIYRAFRQTVPDEDYSVPLGTASVLTEGADLTLLTWGALTRVCLKVVETLREETSIELIDVRSLSPLDDQTIIGSVEKTGRAVVVHEAPRTCGVGAEIAARISEKAFLSLKAPVLRVTGYDTVMPLHKLENHYIPSPERIIRTIRESLAF
jgi:pyruvate dehydrogenase E1 component beta subunit